MMREFMDQGHQGSVRVHPVIDGDARRPARVRRSIVTELAAARANHPYFHLIVPQPLLHRRPSGLGQTVAEQCDMGSAHEVQQEGRVDTVLKARVPSTGIGAWFQCGQSQPRFFRYFVGFGEAQPATMAPSSSPSSPIRSIPCTGAKVQERQEALPAVSPYFWPRS